ncbi:MAG TPA: type I-E CRISPR-associated protein Cse1/CasA [Spirochaetota bacterium]|nr:type I-E CRISPR-associated protein Cse1/CasA [Spirochaetota bacterium]HPI90723.1 type I-E CRISPR-associated protein Cse1/CasA [Spirochaetota bacterium]HPR49744.1 type I-E CRISPR-associated protein Cse1/CasA [Spirochaetota bacterium]
MNLIKDPWLPVIRNNGDEEKIAISQILDSYNTNPVIDIIAPRPDFRNALFQLLIGIIQVALLPENEDEWLKKWDTPCSAAQCNDKILAYEDCFRIDSDGPAFMQDFSLKEFKAEMLTNLFVELPSNEYFNKKTPRCVNPYWAAVTLYALQTFGPAGGRGHKTGLRGGGPVTTILWPEQVKDRQSTLWQKLWVNILSNDYVPGLTGNHRKKNKADIFPWMKPTKNSRVKGNGLYAEECHPFHMFFGMPRRIRLVFEIKDGTCDISGEQGSTFVTSYKTYHSGNDYSGEWIHPLNPYRKDPQNPKNPPNPLKAQPGGITYRYWHRLALLHVSENEIPAPVIACAQTSAQRRKALNASSVKIWAAGYDFNNMKARCWYETMVPFYQLEQEDAKKIADIVTRFLSFTTEGASSVSYRLNEVWFRSSKEKGGDFSHITRSFWENSEGDFYRILMRLVKNISDDRTVSECALDWKNTIISNTLELFDTWALSDQTNPYKMKKTIIARNGLKRALYGSSKKYLNDMLETSQGG